MILKLLKDKRVLSEEEYAAAVATAPNINGLQRKVEESINKDTLFANQSSVVSLPVPQEISEERSGSSQSGESKESAEERGGLETGKPEDDVKK